MKRKRRNKSPNIIPSLNLLSRISGEMVLDNGEDSCGYCFNENGGMLIALDGCGGLGAKRYEQYNLKTGAYIASKATCSILEQWFNDFSLRAGRIDESTIQQVNAELTQFIKSNLGRYRQEESGGLKTKSDMIREFPTTASIVLFDEMESHINTAFFWAGDSRGYILSSDGLAQITSDDLAGHPDAFENLVTDARLKNVLSADGKFHLNQKFLCLQKPFIALSATDGCFGYLKTPMNFEYMLLDTLIEANSPLEWEAKLDEAMSKVAGDDYSLVMAVFGYEDFEDVKRSFVARRDFLYRQYITMLANANPEEKQRMWESYKKDYGRWLD